MKSWKFMKFCFWMKFEEVVDVIWKDLYIPLPQHFSQGKFFYNSSFSSHKKITHRYFEFFKLEIYHFAKKKWSCFSSSHKVTRRCLYPANQILKHCLFILTKILFYYNLISMYSRDFARSWRGGRCIKIKFFILKENILCEIN